MTGATRVAAGERALGNIMDEASAIPSGTFRSEAIRSLILIDALQPWPHDLFQKASALPAWFRAIAEPDGIRRCLSRRSKGQRYAMP